MHYNIGDKIVYTDLRGVKSKAEIYLRKIDYPEKFINDSHHKGGSDYVIQFENNETRFCREAELSQLHN